MVDSNDVHEKNIQDLQTSTAPDLKKENFSFPLSFGKVYGKRKANVETTRQNINERQLSSVLRDTIRPQKVMISSIPCKKKLMIHQQKPSTVMENQQDYQQEYQKEYQEDQMLSDPPPLFVPKENTFSYSAHLRSVTTMALNPKCTILVSGGRDAEIKFWDFSGMTCEPVPFRQITPVSTHCIRAISYSLSGSHILCAAGDAICRLYDIKGFKCQETVKGDMYVRDLSQTKGHTHALTDCCWHPFDREKFYTASEDATVRVFDLNTKPYGVDQALPHLHLLKAVDKRNLNIASQCRVTCVSVAPFSAKTVLAGCSDGSLQQWNERQAYGKPDKVMRTAHVYDTEVSDVEILQDEVRVLSRGLDSTMKLWDLRQFTKPVHTWNDLENNLIGAGLCTNADQTLVVTGTSSHTSEASLHVFDLTSGETRDIITFTSTVPPGKSEPVKGFGIVKIAWPEDLNQLISCCADGTIRFSYDFKYSRKGCLDFMSRPPPNRKKTFEGFQAPIFTVDSLPQGYKETRFGRICRIKSRDHDRQKNERTVQDKTIKSANAPAKFFSGNTEESKIKMAPFCVTAKEDPVELIRAYAEKAAAEPIFTGQAYKDAQPVPILDYSMETTDEEKLMSQSNTCPRCGLKLCQCGYMALAKSIKG